MTGPTWTSNIDMDKLGGIAREGAVRGLTLATEHALGVSRRYVPIEEGTLERSGRASVDPQNLRGVVTYGTPYAVRQHEDMTYKHDEGRSAKYLERAVNEEKDVIMAILQRALAQGLS